MIELLGTLARFAQIASGCALVGWILFRERRIDTTSVPGGGGCGRRGAAGLAAGFLVAGIVGLACQSALVTGQAQDAWSPDAWWPVSIGTLYGRVWWARQGLMLAALLCIGLTADRHRVWMSVAMLAACATAVGVGAGHAAALEPAWPALLSQALHLCALGLWWGGLLPLRAALARTDSDERFTAVLGAFSRRATWAMVVILLSGGYLAWAHVERWPALFGTAYGQLLLTKLGLLAGVLALASVLRWRWLRTASGAPVETLRTRVSRLVFAEWLLATAVVLIGAFLSSTPPARHEQIDWPFPFRLAAELAWSQPDKRSLIIAGALALGLALALVYMRLNRWRWRWLLPSAALALLGAGALSLPAMSVPAFPDTYRTSEVPYHAVSIQQGAALFQRHCSACHGAGGLGDGPRGKGLAVQPADLSAPHASDHTAGDMFWWLTHGMPSGAMPGFADTLDVEARWDLINYLRTFSSGYQARIIRPQIARMQPWLGAPDFNYVTQHGERGALKDSRQERPVLLVFYSWPASADRLRALARLRRADNSVFVLALPWREDVAGPLREIDLPVMVQGGAETAVTYALLRRTLSRADSGDRAAPPTHMEVLIDRFGYLRARWLPGEPGRWEEAEWLRAQIRALNAEPEILPPPDEHIH